MQKTGIILKINFIDIFHVLYMMLYVHLMIYMHDINICLQAVYSLRFKVLTLKNPKHLHQKKYIKLFKHCSAVLLLLQGLFWENKYKHIQHIKHISFKKSQQIIMNVLIHTQTMPFLLHMLNVSATQSFLLTPSCVLYATYTLDTLTYGQEGSIFTLCKQGT